MLGDAQNDGEGEDVPEGVFFLRHNNDLDHIAPIIYKWSLVEGRKSTVVFDGKLIVEGDFRLSMLSVSKLVSIVSLDYILGICEKKNWEEFFNVLVKNILSKSQKKVFIFDHTLSDFSLILCKEIAKTKWKTVSVPHGDDFYKNYLITIDDVDFTGLRISRKKSQFNYFVSLSRKQEHRSRGCVSADRHYTLGSCRYNREWLAVLEKSLPEINIGKNNNNLKVAVFIRNPKYSIFVEEFIFAIRLMLRRSNVCVAIVEHPREYLGGGGFISEIENLKITDFPDSAEGNELLYVGSKNFHSSQIIDWAHAVFSVGTSAVYDAILKGKPVFELDYLHPNRTLISETFHNSDIKCRDDVVRWMDVMLRNKGSIKDFYNEKEINMFKKNVTEVAGGDVLGAYVSFLERVANDV